MAGLWRTCLGVEGIGRRPDSMGPTGSQTCLVLRLLPHVLTVWPLAEDAVSLCSKYSPEQGCPENETRGCASTAWPTAVLDHSSCCGIQHNSCHPPSSGQCTRILQMSQSSDALNLCRKFCSIYKLEPRHLTCNFTLSLDDILHPIQCKCKSLCCMF